MKTAVDSMDNKTELNNISRLKVGVYGFGTTGESLVENLATRVKDIVVYDDIKETPPDGDWPDNLSWKLKPETIDTGLDLLILSPGIPAGHRLVEEAKIRGVEVIGELEFAWRLCEGRVYAVTGTNGKSTCTRLAGAFLKAKTAAPVDVCGNVGRPMIEAVFSHGASETVTYVVEVSSFQVESMQNFKPDHALLTNLGDDHQDRHGSLAEYHGLKWNLLARTRQGGRIVVPVGLRDESRNFVANSEYETAFFSSTNISGRTVPSWSSNGLKLSDGIIPASEFPEILRLFPENLLAAIEFTGIEPVVEKIKKGLAEFNPLDYRAQEITSGSDICVINDSKGTNPHAVAALLAKISSPVRLILGGGSKEADFRPVFEELKNKEIRELLFCGEHKLIHRLDELASEYELKARTVSEWETAVKDLVKNARPGETVLLSPGATSFDAFENYKKRGKKFNSWVREVIVG
ncbi:MAG: UDP-N-acetylmuramoyl-L-alanine--D-glutamate ligase [bacterium]